MTLISCESKNLQPIDDLTLMGKMSSQVMSHDISFTFFMNLKIKTFFFSNCLGTNGRF